jgi:hypothetical protein
MGEAAQAKVQTMQEYLAMGDEYRAAAVEELKRKWREKLKRAHDAVLESKALYDTSSRQVSEYESKIEELIAKCKEATDAKEQFQGEIQALMVMFLYSRATTCTTSMESCRNLAVLWLTYMVSNCAAGRKQTERARN